MKDKERGIARQSKRERGQKERDRDGRERKEERNGEERMPWNEVLTASKAASKFLHKMSSKQKFQMRKK